MISIEAKKPHIDDTISFNKDDFEGVQVPHNDALVVPARISNWRIRRVMINSRASADILFNHSMNRSSTHSRRG